MASSLYQLLMGKQQKSAYDFHNDESLHDSTTAEPRTWMSSLPGDALAVIKNFNVIIKEGPEQGAKHIAGDLDLEDPLSKLISKKLVSMLWGSLLHPPPSYRGLEYRYRTADGSNNSVLFPHLGKASLPYARTVPSTRPPQGARPDPGDLFDLLMAREDDGVESQSGISMMLLYHATVIIHDIFRTDDVDTNSSSTSSYLDLAPLYGSDLETQHSVRQMKNGLLKPDTFAEKRLLNQPPGVCIYIIMYNRFHNYVAKQLKEINEHGRFNLPPGCKDSEEARQDPKWKDAFELHDEHLFQTARLVTCGMYINVAIHDYLRCLMGVHPLDTPWTLDPRKSLPESDNKKGLDRGEGNMVSAEFNMLYRFHSPISKRDAWWSEDLFVGALRDYVDDSDTPAAREAIKKGEKFTSKMIKDGEFPVGKFKQWLDELKKPNPRQTPDKDLPFFPEGLDMVGARRGDWYRFKRNKDGKFDDAQLAAEMSRVIEDPICQFGAQNIPKVFKSIEIMGILQARRWELATLNEFREFFGMSRFKTFEEVNSNKDIQDKLRYLYEDPDCIELYPGLFCEGQGRNLDPGVPMPEKAASSLWRGVFSDAVTLVRSDRFYTLDWNVGSLTAWGMNEVTSDPKVNKGSVLARLFERAFPGCFEYNSLHMWQPFYTPTMNAQLAHDQGYLRFLNLNGLEDKNGQELVFTASENQIFVNNEPYTKWTNTIKKNLVRRTLHKPNNPGQPPKWRGEEFVVVKQRPVEVSCFNTIKTQILGGPSSKDWVNPVNMVPTDIPAGPLREVMTQQWTKIQDAAAIVQKNLPNDWEQVFMDYFVGITQDIRIREQRPLQKRTMEDGSQVQSYQLDIVKDLAIPVVTRFFADFLGFWDEVKTPEFLNRKFNENEIYHHIENCQASDAYDSDPTRAWRRRMDFQASIKVLKELADDGVRKSQHGWLENIAYRRNYGTDKDGQYVRDLRKIGVNTSQALLKQYTQEQVAAFMLVTSLDTAQRFVLTFSEAIAYFIDPTKHNHLDITGAKEDVQTKTWAGFKNKAWEDTVINHKNAVEPRDRKNDMDVTSELERYVLEAARLSNPMDLVRVYKPVNKADNEVTITVDAADKKSAVARGETVLINLRQAYLDPESGLQDAKVFELRTINDYIGFGPTISATGVSVPPRFAKRAALIGLTGIMKHCAHLQELRVAHDKAGRLKRVKTVDGYRRYASPKWDLLLSYPTTWNVRYDGLGTKLFTQGDNANQGHGEDMVWSYESLSSQVDSQKLKKQAEEAAIQKRIDEAVQKAVKEALDKERTTAPPPAPVGQDKARPRVMATEVAAYAA